MGFRKSARRIDQANCTQDTVARWMILRLDHILFSASVLLLVVFICPLAAWAQSDSVTIRSTLHAHSVTYNGSEDPNECMESVAWGVILPCKNSQAFFLLDYQVLQELKQKISAEEIVQFEVAYFSERLRESHAIGAVLRVRRGNEVLFEEK